jgi:hypothetical protein
MTILQVKLVHTGIFAVLSVCVLYVFISGNFNRITGWTWGGREPEGARHLLGATEARIVFEPRCDAPEHPPHPDFWRRSPSKRWLSAS